MDKKAVISALIEGGAAWDAVQPRVVRDGLVQGADLCEISFVQRDLAEMDFSGGDFFKTNFERTNLKKSRFSGADLSHARLHAAALYKADFSGAVLQEADLSAADLSATTCAGADFRGANLAGVNFADADLRGADFSYADLRGADLTRADVTGAKFHFARLADANVTHLAYGDYTDMVGLYYGIRGIEATFGNALFVRDAKDQDYIDTLQQALLDMEPGFKRRAELFLFSAWGLIDHGRSLLKVALYAFVIATIYGVFYTLDMAYDWQIMDYSSSAKTWFTPFYYSVVTYTTLGFGDVTADSLFGEILVISEVIFGYFTLGLLLAILANTIARRS